MSFKGVWVCVSIVAVAILPGGPASAWSLGVGHLPSCAYICLDRSLSLQSSCQDLKCICKQPNLLAANEACFRKECDLNSLSKALKLPATCQESFGVTPTPPEATPTRPESPPSPQPATGYAGYPYPTVPPYYAYPYPRVIAPTNTVAAVLLPGIPIPAPNVSLPEAPPSPQAWAPASQASAAPPQFSSPEAQTFTPGEAMTSGTSNSSRAHPATSTSTSPLFPSPQASHAAGDAAWSSAPRLLRHQLHSPLCLLALFSSVGAYLL